MSKGNPYGKGYNSGGKYKPTTIIDGKKKNTPQYSSWINMLGRCYNPNFHKKKPTYKDCEVCEEWLDFQNYAKWYDENYYQIDNDIMSLDKDILKHGNKIYSPNNCVFVNNKINSLLTSCKSVRGSLPIGITYKNNKYCVRVSNYICKHKRINIGYFETIEEAFIAYKQEKENVIKQVADLYKNKIPKNLYDAMYNYEIKITD